MDKVYFQGNGKNVALIWYLAEGRYTKQMVVVVSMVWNGNSLHPLQRLQRGEARVSVGVVSRETSPIGTQRPRHQELVGWK